MKHTYLMLALALVAEIAADYFFKLWSLSDKTLEIVTGVGLYCIATVFFALSLKNESLTKMVCVFTIINCVAASLIGIYFGEPFPLRIKLGVLTAMLTIYLLR